MTLKPKTLVIVASELEESPLEALKKHDGYCETAADCIASMAELPRYGVRYRGAWRVTIEKVSPKVVKTWRKMAKESAK